MAGDTHVVAKDQRMKSHHCRVVIGPFMYVYEIYNIRIKKKWSYNLGTKMKHKNSNEIKNEKLGINWLDFPYKNFLDFLPKIKELDILYPCSVG